MYNELYSTVDKKENESDFQKSLSEYFDDDCCDKDVPWKKMYLCVYYACLNICKSIFVQRHVIIDDEKMIELAEDSATYCMKFIKNGVRPNKLSSYCYLRCVKFIDDKKQKWYDENITEMTETVSKKLFEDGVIYE